MVASQVWLSMLIPYGFDNNKAAEYIALQRLDMLPTARAIQDELNVYNAEWWVDNGDKSAREMGELAAA